MGRGLELGAVCLPSPDHGQNAPLTDIISTPGRLAVALYGA